MLNPQSVVFARANVLSTEIGDEVMLLSMESNASRRLNSFGTYVWQLLDEPTLVSDLEEDVIEAFDTDSMQASASIMQLLDELLEQGFIEVDTPEEDV